MLDIESRFFVNSSDPHCPSRRWHGSILHWRSSSLSPGRREHKSCSNQSMFTLSVSGVFASFFKGASGVTSCQLRSIPTSTSEPVRQMFPEVFPTPVASLVSSSVPALLSQVTCCFEFFFYVFLANGLLPLLLHKPIAFERNLWSWPWSCEPFEQNSISVLRNHSVDALFLAQRQG